MSKIKKMVGLTSMVLNLRTAAVLNVSVALFIVFDWFVCVADRSSLDKVVLALMSRHIDHSAHIQ